MAAQAIRTGSIENALVIGAETLSRFTFFVMQILHF